MSTERFEEIVSRYVDGVATAEDLAELEGLLRDDPALRKSFVERMRLEVSLNTLSESRAEAAGEAVTSRRAAQAVASRRTTRGFQARPGISSIQKAWIAAAAVLAAAAIFFAVRRPAPQEPVEQARRPEVREPAPRTEDRRKAEEEKGRAEEDRKVLEEQLAALRKREGEAARERGQRDQEEAQELRRKAEESLKKIQADREAAEASLREADARERRALEEVTRVQEKEASQKPVQSPSATEVAAARLDRVEGEVYVMTRAGRRVATPGQDLLAGEGVVSEGIRSFAVLSYADKSRLELSGNATIRDLFEGDPATRKGKRAFIEKGSVKADIAAQPKDQPMVLATPQAESRILGTTFRLTVDPDPKKGTALEVEEGRVELRTVAGKSVDVVAGRMAVATLGAAPVVRALPKEEVLLALDFEDGKTSPLVTMGSVEKGPDHPGSRFCLSGIPDPSGVCKLFIGADARGLFTVQGDEILSFDYWADPQAGQVNFNFYSRSRGQTFEGVVPKAVFGKWAHATIRLADLGAPDRRLHAEDWVVGLYMQAVGSAVAKRFYIDNLQVIRSRVLKPRPSEAKK